MNERASHFTIIVGASPVAEGLRRLLVQRRMPHAGIASQIRSLRRALVLSEHDLTVICVAVDRPTIDRYGSRLRGVLADRDCFPTALRSIGLLGGAGLTPDAAQLGCDVYASSSAQAFRVARQLVRRWRQQLADRLQPSACRAYGGCGGIAGIRDAEYASLEESIGFSPLEPLPRLRPYRFMGSIPVHRPSSKRDRGPGADRCGSSGGGGPG